MRTLTAVLGLAAALVAVGFAGSWWLGRGKGFDGAIDAPAGKSELTARGRYLAAASGCRGCHTRPGEDGENGRPYAGGRGIETAFGTFYSPNITPDPETGIGKWSDRAFVNALRHGLRPDGQHYFPVFPYTSYTGLRIDDILAIKAYLFSLAPVRAESRAHDVPWPVSVRFLQGYWKWFYFEPGSIEADPNQSAEWNRGAYLVNAAGHCGECHTPRSILGGLEQDLALAGSRDALADELAPNITPDPATGIGDWRSYELVDFLKTGLKPDYDDVQGAMEEVVSESTSKLTDADLEAVSSYLMSLDPKPAAAR